MPSKSLFPLVLASAVLTLNLRGAGWADSVVNYNPGSGFASGYTEPNSALGEPARVTPGQFGGPVDPFNPPYLKEQLVSVGAGGSLTLRMDSPVVNNGANPFGFDFSIFGGSGFVITNGDFSGGGITDGTLFGDNKGSTRVSVSADGSTFYELSPSLAPVVDGPFPTDGAGDFRAPVDPSLKAGSFGGKNLAEIRRLYKGSGGGTPFDISWARNAQGQPVDLASIQYIRIDVLTGASEIDGIVAVPEPSSLVLLSAGAGLLMVWRARKSGCR